MALISALCLVLVGLIFGFHIQVSETAVSILASMGSILGGMGAAGAAYISYRSTKEWKNEFYHGKQYEHVLQLESLLLDINAALNKAIHDESVTGLRLIGALHKSTAPFQKDYKQSLNSLRLISRKSKNESASNVLEQLDIDKILMSMHEPFLHYRDSQSRIDDYFKNNPNEERQLFEITEIKDDMKLNISSLFELTNILNKSEQDLEKFKQLVV